MSITVAARTSWLCSRRMATPSLVVTSRWSGTSPTETPAPGPVSTQEAWAAGLINTATPTRLTPGPSRRAPARTTATSRRTTNSRSSQRLLEPGQPQQVASVVRRPADHEDRERDLVLTGHTFALPDPGSVSYAGHRVRRRPPRACTRRCLGECLGPQARNLDRVDLKPLAG